MRLPDDLQTQLDKVLAENARLREENRRLRKQLGLPVEGADLTQVTASAAVPISDTVTSLSSVEAKIVLFRSLFQGREDVFAVRWEGRNGLEILSSFRCNMGPESKATACFSI